jgi:hypothetical protein
MSLESNQISDISSLADNKGLGYDERVDIEMNSLECSDTETVLHIQTLEERGVDVKHDCW